MCLSVVFFSCVCFLRAYVFLSEYYKFYIAILGTLVLGFCLNELPTWAPIWVTQYDPNANKLPLDHSGQTKNHLSFASIHLSYTYNKKWSVRPTSLTCKVGTLQPSFIITKIAKLHHNQNSVTPK
jgi:hypothetical protein